MSAHSKAQTKSKKKKKQESTSKLIILSLNNFYVLLTLCYILGQLHQVMSVLTDEVVIRTAERVDVKKVNIFSHLLNTYLHLFKNIAKNVYVLFTNMS